MPIVERIPPRTADLGGGLSIRRALPTRQRRMVGAWCFLDHVGPLTGGSMHVDAHPHTALQTFTWMIEGEILHRDSLGHEQIIRPGQVNLMTAGHGIVHSEDSLPHAERLHAAQLWIALPYAEAQRAPDFAHHPDLPRWNTGTCQCTLLAGSHDGRTAPASLYTPLVGIDLHSVQGASLELPLRRQFEYGLLVLQGAADLGDEHLTSDEFVYLGDGNEHLSLSLAPDSRLLLLGGAPYGEAPVMWWNFVGHSRADVAAALRDWESGSPRFGRVAGDADSPRRRLSAPPWPWSGA